MNVQEKMTMLKCYAYQKRESQGIEGKEAGMLEDWINEETFGSDLTVTEPDPASLTLVSPGENITNYRSVRYYNFTFAKSTKVLTMNASFSQVGIVGIDGDWNTDVVMTQNYTDGVFYADVEIEAATEFKFRLDGAWTTSWGGTVDELELNSSVNLKIEDPGNYRIYLDKGKFLLLGHPLF